MVKKQKLIEVNADNYFRNNIFSDAIQYGKQLKSVEGVAEVLSAINDKQHIYMSERDIFVKEKNVSIKEKLEKAKERRKISRITLLIFIGILLLDLCISIPFLIKVIFFGIMFCTYIAYDDARGKYNHEVSDAKKLGEGICWKYDAEAQRFYVHIDDLYLASLEPTHRETVLMRREQERYQREMMQLQREQIRLENERMEEQRKSRIAQEELLRIERMREERIRRNSY